MLEIRKEDQGVHGLQALCNCAGQCYNSDVLSSCSCSANRMDLDFTWKKLKSTRFQLLMLRYIWLLML